MCLLQTLDVISIHLCSWTRKSHTTSVPNMVPTWELQSLWLVNCHWTKCLGSWSLWYPTVQLKALLAGSTYHCHPMVSWVWPFERTLTKCFPVSLSLDVLCTWHLNISWPGHMFFIPFNYILTVLTQNIHFQTGANSSVRQTVSGIKWVFSFEDKCDGWWIFNYTVLFLRTVFFSTLLMGHPYYLANSAYHRQNGGNSRHHILEHTGISWPLINPYFLASPQVT